MARFAYRIKADVRIVQQRAGLGLLDKGDAVPARDKRLRERLHGMNVTVKRGRNDRVVAHSSSPTRTSRASRSALILALPVQKQATRNCSITTAK